jgi:uncharacterized protein (TIGR02186 family)
VTSGYHGSTLDVDIVVPSRTDIALKLEGRSVRVTFNRKGRVFFLWMNVGEVSVADAPRAYMLSTSKGLADLAPPDTLRRLGLGLDALRARIETEGAGIDRETVLLEFFKYAEKRGLYRRSYGSLQRAARTAGDDGAGRERYSARIELPAGIPVGAYDVDLYVFEDGSLLERASDTVTVAKTGFPLLVSRFAREHPGEYGLLAIIVAVIAGYSVGFVFSQMGRRAG